MKEIFRQPWKQGSQIDNFLVPFSYKCSMQNWLKLVQQLKEKAENGQMLSTSMD